MLFFKIVFPSSFNDVDITIDKIINFLKEKCGLKDESFLFKTDFILRELLINAVEHGNKMDISKKVSCSIKCSDTELKIEVSDEGDGFICKYDFTDMSHEDGFRVRVRGINTIVKMGVNLRVQKNHVYAKLSL